jgi:hypothetical protein
MHYFWQNNGMGYILSDVFTNSSGHPVLPWNNLPEAHS